MDKEEFRERWEKDESGDGITWEEIAECAKDWGLTSSPKTLPMHRVLNLVLGAAGLPLQEEPDETDY